MLDSNDSEHLLFLRANIAHVIYALSDWIMVYLAGNVRNVIGLLARQRSLHGIIIGAKSRMRGSSERKRHFCDGQNRSGMD